MSIVSDNEALCDALGVGPLARACIKAAARQTSERCARIVADTLAKRLSWSDESREAEYKTWLELLAPPEDNPDA